MGWPDEVQYAKDSNGNVIGLITNNGIMYFSFGMQSGVPIGMPPAGNIGSNGALTLGTQVGGGTITFGATSGSTSCTASVAAFAAADVGKVITVDSGKQATITAFTSTTIVTVTLGSTLSGAGPHATWYMAWPFYTIYGDIYLYFPADAIFSGSAAGFYYTVMSSTTIGTIYTDRFLGAANEVPTIPALPTAFTGKTGVNYTQPTSAINGINFTIPAGRMGRNGKASAISLVARSKDTASVAYSEHFNAQSSYVAGLAGSSATSLSNTTIVKNRGAANKQITTPNNSSLGLGVLTSQPYRYMSHNTDLLDIPYASAFTITTQGTWIILESFDIEVSPSL
jgi:hypothetical protein